MDPFGQYSGNINLRPPSPRFWSVIGLQRRAAAGLVRQQPACRWLGSAVRFSAPFSSLLGLLPQYSSESHLPDISGVLLCGVLICETRSISLDFFLCVSV